MPEDCWPEFGEAGEAIAVKAITAQPEYEFAIDPSQRRQHGQSAKKSCRPCPFM
jgi:hypothetical protein